MMWEGHGTRANLERGPGGPPAGTAFKVLNEKDVPEDPGAWDRVAERLQRGLGVLVLFLPTNMEVFQYF